MEVHLLANWARCDTSAILWYKAFVTMWEFTVKIRIVP